MEGKKIASKLLCLLFLIISVFSFTSYAYDDDSDSVSDREILLLSVLSYNNEQKEDVTTMTNIRFLLEPFCNYASLSELQGWKAVEYSNINPDLSSKSGFSAVCYKKNNNVVIAFRGTDSNIVMENKSYLVPFKRHAQAKHAVEYVDFVSQCDFIDENTKIYVCGHSLGGYLAMYATPYVLHNDVLKDKFVKTVTFNGLRIGNTSDKIVTETLKSLSSSQIVNYRTNGDIVSVISKKYNPQITLEVPQWYRNIIPKNLRGKLKNHSLMYFLPLIANS